MTDHKKSKYIRLSSEYYGGLTVTYQYVQMKDDEPPINFYTYETLDQGWFIIENEGTAKMLLEEQAKIKLNKYTARYFADSDIEYDDNEVIKFSRIDNEASYEHIKETYNCTEEQVRIWIDSGKHKEMLFKTKYKIDCFELPVRVEFINDFDAPYKRLPKELTSEDEKGYKE